MEQFSYCFGYGTSYLAPKRLNELKISLMQSPLKVMSVVEALVKGVHTDIRLQVLQYLLRVFTLLCESFNDELSYIKFQMRGNDTLGYLRAFAQHRHNSVLLMKKLL
jgi:hypothetical protein